MTKLALGHTHTHTHTHTHLGFLLLENHHSYFGYHGARCNRERLDWTDIYPKLLLCCNSVIGLYINIVQRDATQSSQSIILQVHSTCFGCQPHSSSGVHKTVTTASGTGHIFCAATALQRGQVGHVGGK